MYGRLAIFISIALVAPPLDASGQEQCADVPSCINDAYRDPGRYSETLRESLARLPAPVLLAGLKWTSPRGDTERVHQFVLRVLRIARDHTPESARELLELAKTQHPELFFSLQMDPVGRREIARAYDADPAGPWGLRLAMIYLGSDGPLLHNHQGEVDEQRLEQFSELLWKKYLEQRAAQKIEKDVSAAALGASRNRPRLIALAQAEIDAGRLPLQDELVVLSWSPEGARALLEWEESASPTIKDGLLRSFLNSLRSVSLEGPIKWTPAEQTRIRAVIWPQLGRETNSGKRSILIDALKDHVEGVTAEEAKRLADLLFTDDPVAVARLAEADPKYLEPLVNAFRTAPLEKLRFWNMYSEPNPMVKKAVLVWLNELKPEQLREEAMQERFLAVINVLQTREFSVTSVPGAWRSRPRNGAPPEELTPQEETARWMEYVFALEDMRERCAAADHAKAQPAKPVMP